MGETPFSMFLDLPIDRRTGRKTNLIGESTIESRDNLLNVNHTNLIEREL